MSSTVFGSSNPTSTRPLRVAVYYDLPSGGAKRALHAQLAGLRARGHVLHAFVPSTADESFLPIDDVVSVVTRWSRPTPPERDDVLSGRRMISGSLRWASFLRHLHASEREIGQAISRSTCDVAFVQPSQFTQAPLVLGRLLMPTMYYCQESLRAAYEPRVAAPLVRHLVRETLGRLDRRLVRRASVVAVNSSFSAETIRRVYQVPVRIIPLGVDPTAFRPLHLCRERFVLSVGAIHPLKGHEAVIDAVAAIPPNGRPAVRIVGDRSRGDEANRLRHRAAVAGVTLDILQRVSEPELLQLYNSAAMVVLAPWAEPFGLAALEAMACATPVIAVDEGGLRETVGRFDSSFLVSRDPQRIAERVRSLLDDPSAATSAGERARRYVLEHWTWARAVDALEVELFRLRATREFGPSQRVSRASSR